MNTELVRAVFDCGIDDLRLLDDAECDMYAVIGRMREEGIELTMNNIIRQVFEEAVVLEPVPGKSKKRRDTELD